MPEDHRHPAQGLRRRLHRHVLAPPRRRLRLRLAERRDRGHGPGGRREHHLPQGDHRGAPTPTRCAGRRSRSTRRSSPTPTSPRPTATSTPSSRPTETRDFLIHAIEISAAEDASRARPRSTASRRSDAMSEHETFTSLVLDDTAYETRHTRKFAARKRYDAAEPERAARLHSRRHPGDPRRARAAGCARGDPLLVLEAMKMRNDVVSPRDGVIESRPRSGRRHGDQEAAPDHLRLSPTAGWHRNPDEPSRRGRRRRP